MVTWIRKKTKQLNNFIWRLFVNGLLTILPIALTIVIFKITFTFIINWLEPLRRFVPPYLAIVPYGEVILALLIIFSVGTILKIFVLRSIINKIENILLKLPLIRPIYTGMKQLVQALSAQDKITFRKVVLIEFPRKGMYSIGFVTSALEPKLAPNKEDKFYNIFIPTTPNPTSGYFVMLPERDIMIINITRQEAMAMIISGGIIQPESMSCKLSEKENLK